MNLQYTTLHIKTSCTNPHKFFILIKRLWILNNVSMALANTQKSSNFVSTQFSKKFTKCLVHEPEYLMRIRILKKYANSLPKRQNCSFEDHLALVEFVISIYKL